MDQAQLNPELLLPQDELLELLVVPDAEVNAGWRSIQPLVLQ
jgi:hypothetical protein